MTNCHKLDKLKLTNLFSYNSGCHKSKIKWLDRIKLPPGTLRELFHFALSFQYFQEFHAWVFLAPISTLIFTWISPLCLFSIYTSLIRTNNLVKDSFHLKIPNYILKNLLSKLGLVYIFRGKIHRTFSGTFNLSQNKDSAVKLFY